MDKQDALNLLLGYFLQFGDEDLGMSKYIKYIYKKNFDFIFYLCLNRIVFDELRKCKPRSN